MSDHLFGATGGSRIHDIVAWLNRCKRKHAKADWHFISASRRSIAERLLWMDGVVVREPTIELLDHRGSTGSWADLCIVALRGLHEGLCHTI